MDQEPSELSYADVKVIVAELRLSIANLEAAAHGLETAPAIERNKVSDLPAFL